MKALTTVILVLLAIFTLTGCFEEESKTPAISSTDTPYLPDNVSGINLKSGFKIVSFKKIYDGECTSFNVIVANTGKDPGRNVKIVIHVLKNGIIFDTVDVYFADGEYIIPGDKAIEKIIFKNLSHDDYDCVKYILS